MTAGAPECKPGRFAAGLTRLRSLLPDSGGQSGLRASARSAINLLPWRDFERARGNKVLLAALGGVLGAAVTLIYASAWALDNRVELQDSRNRLLERESAVLQTRIAEVRRVRGQREQLLERMAVIQRLRNRRQVTVRIFDELANTLPDGMHYQRVELQDGSLKVRGVAASNERISLLMRNLTGSAWFAAPNLERIREVRMNSAYGPGAGTFEMTFVLQPPDAGAAAAVGR